MHHLFVALVLIAGFMNSSLIYSQKWNLVKNGGFEDLVGVNCPSAYEMLDRQFVQDWQGTDSEILVKDCEQFGWDANIGSTPYTSTNFCELNSTSVPENNVYAGFFVKSGPRSEYVGGDLKSELISNVTYKVTVDVALSKAYPNTGVDSPYKGVMKNFEWQFIGEPYEVHGESLSIPGHGEIETGGLNEDWVGDYKIPRSTISNHWFKFDYFQLKPTAINPITPYLNVANSPSEPLGTTGDVHEAIGMPSSSSTNLMYYTWFTISKELKPGDFPTDKKNFLFGMFYNPSANTNMVSPAPSYPVCTMPNWSPTCGPGGGFPYCPSAGATPQCPDPGTQVTCEHWGPSNPSDPYEPAMIFPLCPHNSSNTYYFLDNVVLTCDPKVEMDVQWKSPLPGSSWQDWVTSLEHNSTHVEKILCGTEINLRGSQENIAAEDGHRWSVYSHPQGVTPGDNSNKCNPGITERRIYETDNNPWIGNGPFPLEDLLENKYRQGEDYSLNSPLIQPAENFITLYDTEEATIVNEGSCHRKANATEEGANSPFIGKHYTFSIIPPELSIQVEHTSPVSNPSPPNPQITEADLQEHGKTKDDPIKMMCGDDLQIKGTVTELNNNAVQWIFRADLPNGTTYPAPELFSPNDNTKRISQILGNTEIPRSEFGDSEVEVGLAGTCQSGPIRTKRAGGDTRFFKIMMSPPELFGGGEINCKDLNSESGLLTAISSINPDFRHMEWQVKIKQNSLANQPENVASTTENFNPADPDGIQEITLQTLLNSTNLNNVSLADGDTIEVGFGDQCTGPIKSDLQYRTVQFTIVGDPLKMEVHNNTQVCDGVKREENVVNLLTPATFTLTGSGLTETIDWVIYDPNDEGNTPQFVVSKEHGVYSDFFVTPNQASGTRPNGDKYHSIMVRFQHLFQTFPDHFDINNRNEVLIKGFARDSGNCGAVAELKVKVEVISNPVPLFFPNVISANDDGTNDHFMVGIGTPEDGLMDGLNLQNVKFTIFNRWGGIEHFEEAKSVSFGSEFHTQWNGRNQKTGERNQTGVYVFLMTYELGQCKSLMEARDVTVLR